MQWYATVLIQLSSASSSLLHFSKGNKLVIVLINPKWSNLVCRSSLSTIISYLCGYIILGACNSHWEERVDGKPEADFYPLTALSLCLIKKKKKKKTTRSESLLPTSSLSLATTSKGDGIIPVTDLDTQTSGAQSPLQGHKATGSQAMVVQLKLLISSIFFSFFLFISPSITVLFTSSEKSGVWLTKSNAESMKL